MNYVMNYEEFLSFKDKENILPIDLRTPREFKEATIPGSVSLPLFSDEEHREISTIYVQRDKEEAKALGVRYASQKLPFLFETLLSKVKAYDKVVLFCYRGGMRSSVLFSLARSLNLPIYKLSGGYKEHRRYVHSHWEEVLKEKNFLSLYGYTGTGKTKILRLMERRGVPVLDLEGLANHRGSLLGGIGLGAQPSQKMFESLLWEKLHRLPSGNVFLEGESRKVGDLFLPNPVYDKLIASQKILIEASLPKRILTIREEYTRFSLTELERTLSTLEPYIGKTPLARLQDELRRGDLNQVIRFLCESYYDPKYTFHPKDYICSFTNEEEEECLRSIAEYFSIDLSI